MNQNTVLAFNQRKTPLLSPTEAERHNFNALVQIGEAIIANSPDAALSFVNEELRRLRASQYVSWTIIQNQDKVADLMIAGFTEEQARKMLDQELISNSGRPAWQSSSNSSSQAKRGSSSSRRGRGGRS